MLVEKPLAATPTRPRPSWPRRAATGVPVQVGHVERFNPAVLELGRLLDAGWLSTVYAITSRRAGPFPARIRDVGVTIDLATHDVDILSWIAGERPIRVFAETAQRIHADHEDLLFGLMSFPSGTVAMLDVDWLTPAKRRQLTVVGEEGMFELDYLTQRLTFTRGVRADQPAPDRRLCADLRRRGRRVLAGRERGAAAGRARRLHPRRPRRRPADRGRRGRSVGRRPRRTPS